MHNVKIQSINKIGEGERGNTYEYSIREKSDFILLERKKGSISGNTYHKGTTITTDPKIFILLSGKIEFQYRNIKENDHQINIVQAPAMIEVPPLFTHAVKAISDILMLECNSISDIENDRYKDNVIKEATT